MTRQTGKLRSWNEARGFGFIAPTGGGRELFVHVSALPRGAGQPTVGETLSYVVAQNDKGQPQAQVQREALAGAPAALARPQPGRAAAPAAAVSRGRTKAEAAAFGTASLFALPALLLLYILLAAVWRLPLTGLAGYAGMSLLTFVCYALDKRAAQRQSRRTPESSLHLLSLFGGWPGALIAQQRLRHKSVKAAFRSVFWFTVLANVLGLVLLASPLGAALLPWRGGSSV